ncbi:MAG: hypothetical protein H7Y12_11540 [Sphingobacteriaceae bacterium]|nr:hypothetical protein [Cytophagaceae bacterium]
MQWNGYVQWQFLEPESNLTPYFSGTYLSTKKIFTLSAGFVVQPEGMWQLGEKGRDTVTAAMRQLAADAYFEAPLGRKGEALNAYSAFVNFDFRPNYTHNNGVMNPANGNRLPTVLNGAGNVYPLVGTGNVVYLHLGYKFPNGLLGTFGTLMPTRACNSPGLTACTRR